MDGRRNSGSALLITVIGAGILSVCFLMLFTSGMFQVKLQRRILMRENNFCYLEYKMETLRLEIESMTGEIAEECSKKAWKKAREAAEEEAEKEAAEKNEKSAEAEETEIDMDLAQEFYEERMFRILKRRLCAEELESLLRTEETEDESLFITLEKVIWEEDTILVKHLRLNGSAPGGRIRSSVSADLRIFIPDLLDEEETEEESEKVMEKKLDKTVFGKRRKSRASSSELVLDEAFSDIAVLEQFQREKRSFEKTGELR